MCRETRGDCGAGGSCVTGLRHVTAQPCVGEDEENASDVRLAGGDYVGAWLPAARFLGARRGGRASRWALGGAWARRGAETAPVARSGWGIMLLECFGRVGDWGRFGKPDGCVCRCFVAVGFDCLRIVCFVWYRIVMPSPSSGAMLSGAVRRTPAISR